jgi:RNA polymerase sigma-70 factor, ECF subfamily
MSETAATHWVGEDEIVDLIQRAQEYDAAAFDRLYETYAHSIFRYLYHRLGDREVAEDLTGEVFLRLMENIGNFRVGPRDQKAIFSGWLYRIAHNLMIDYLRRQAKHTEMTPDTPSTSEDHPTRVMERGLSAERVRTAMHHLTQDQKDVVILRFFEELSNAEVAKIMGRTEGAVKALQHRALAALHRALTGESTL